MRNVQWAQRYWQSCTIAASCHYLVGKQHICLMALCVFCRFTNDANTNTLKRTRDIHSSAGLFTSHSSFHLFCLWFVWSSWPVVILTGSDFNIHPFNGPFSGTTQVSWYQKSKTNLDFTDATDTEWQWHQLGHMQVCTLLQTDNHASTPLLSFLQAGLHQNAPNT